MQSRSPSELFAAAHTICYRDSRLSVYGAQSFVVVRNTMETFRVSDTTNLENVVCWEPQNHRRVAIDACPRFSPMTMQRLTVV